MHITARVDYALRAMLALAAAEPATLTAQQLAESQHLPLTYLYTILAELRRAGYVQARRGKVDGGYTLARPASEITLGDIVRAMDGPLSGVGGVPVEHTPYDGAATHLPRIWLAANAAMLGVVDQVSLADAIADPISAEIEHLTRPLTP